MKKWIRIILPASFLFLAAGCAPTESGGGQVDYEETKKMVVDILKTDDGKKAIQEVMGDDGMKEKLIMDQPVVTDTIEKTLTSDKGMDFWKKSFEDPKFAESVAKSMKKENEKLLKDLMKDPEYKGMMIEVMKDPELEKELTNVLKSKEYREHLQKVMNETFESPLFKAKLQALIVKAAEELPTQKPEGGGQGGGGDSGGGGGSSASGGGSGGQ
ncbi:MULTISPECIES: spore germination lipoprotein GerD [unclassified Mesobacillus]|uniref:spore germination lipoprotein GerD n=1 Tax=unclassified Mesobacillus TaxID=2675270 RepID=UPI0020408BE7|nr:MULTISPECIES: spore germination lipoprotein GerD [unclassified Mesobacillus]MCM3125789.1 spore germination lipoprotein GerD [Mesobacillus sp. MER 33]MCM3235810.1 spore germination lipoprotein GerD [Mesobacillus sp. MER 48]